jgi:hypothetical protein
MGANGFEVFMKVVFATEHAGFFSDCANPQSGERAKRLDSRARRKGCFEGKRWIHQSPDATSPRIHHDNRALMAAERGYRSQG